MPSAAFAPAKVPKPPSFFVLAAAAPGPDLALGLGETGFRLAATPFGEIEDVFAAAAPGLAA